MRKPSQKINHKIILIVVVLLLLISVGYAALSTTLTINGTANIQSNSWLVYFTNVQVRDGSVTATQTPTTSGTSTTNLTWTVLLEKPGDFYEYDVDVKNDGTIDAMIGSLSNTSLTTNQAKYLNYSVTYDDGAAIERYDKLDAGDMVTLKVRVEYKTDLNPEDLPTETSVVAFTYTSNYIQADGNAKAKNRNGTPVGYAVQIYGINEDVDENDNPIGLTFGPATGDNYRNKYVTHRYEETSTGSGVYNVIIVTHTVATNGDETITETNLTNSVSENVTRTEEQKNKYDINMHEMTWAQIAAVSDKTNFLDCMLCGDTKKVELYLNDIIGRGITPTQNGDGAGALCETISLYYKLWNPSSNSPSFPERDNPAVGIGVTITTDEQKYGSNAQNAGGYSVSHIRATLIGQNAKTNISYAGDVNLNETNSLYSCLPSSLKSVITAKKVRYVTGTSKSNYSLNDDIADKIWAFSNREMYGTGEYSGYTTEGLGNNGHGYSKFANSDSKYYILSYNHSSSTQRRCYDEYGNIGEWWLRSLCFGWTSSIAFSIDATGSFSSCVPNLNFGLSFGFCIN